MRPIQSLILPALLVFSCAGSDRGSDLACGTDTKAVGGVCKPVISCGTGTTRKGDACEASGGGGSLCGTDTRLDGDSCVGVVTCGGGTTRNGNSCLGSNATLSCGAGTTRSGDQCIASSSGGVTCGAGTTLSGAQCIASGGTLTCGPGTVRSGDKCVPGSATTTTISTFLSTPKQVYVRNVAGGAIQYEYFVTNLDDAQARAYQSVNATPLGGPFDALFIRLGEMYDYAPERPDVQTFAVRAPPTCTMAAIRTVPQTDTDVHIGFVRDFAGTPTAICANAGSMTLGYNSAGDLTAVVTTQFSDGTLLTAREFVPSP